MTFDPLFDLRRLLGDFNRLEFDEVDLQRFLLRAAEEAARSGLLVQEQEVINLQAGVIEYALHPRWVQSFAVLHEEVQSYLAIKDQASVIWYVTATDQGSLLWSDTKPSGFDLTPANIPYWVQWISPDNATWYLWPSLLGSTTVGDAHPATGTGMVLTVELQSHARFQWLTSITNQASNQLTAFSPVQADLKITAQDAQSLTLIIPQYFGRFGRISPTIPPGPPQAVTIWKGRLWVTPTPDANYQLDHKFFALPLANEHVYDLPQAFMQLPTWKAMALALRSQGRLEASQHLASIFSQLVSHLGVLYRASARESRDEVALPK